MGERRGLKDSKAAGTRADEKVGRSTPSEPLFVENVAELRAWFRANHETADELFLGFYRARTGKQTVTWAEAVDEALCVGWIDSILRGLDDEAYVQRFTPRRKRSIWSAVNVANVARLSAAGRMLPAGLAAFEARTPDRMGVYSFEQAEMPALNDEEEARFRADEAAWAWFSAKSPSFRRQALHWVTSAKRAETRERRLATLIADSAAGRAPRPLDWSRDPGKV